MSKVVLRAWAGVVNLRTWGEARGRITHAPRLVCPCCRDTYAATESVYVGDLCRAYSRVCSACAPDIVDGHYDGGECELPCCAVKSC